jgi:hypothetical protein
VSPGLIGGCNCGAVRFEITEPLLRARYCHCTVASGTRANDGLPRYPERAPG